MPQLVQAAPPFQSTGSGHHFVPDCSRQLLMGVPVVKPHYIEAGKSCQGAGLRPRPQGEAGALGVEGKGQKTLSDPLWGAASSCPPR